MKSIMEEASSIAKAIETAWNRAGQPTEFTVKVLELPQTSFFGLKTSKSAKVAFFFNEATVQVKSKESGTRHETNDRQQRSGGRPAYQRPNRSESDQQRRPHHSQRSDYAKPVDSRSPSTHKASAGTASAHSEEHRLDVSRRSPDSSERPERIGHEQRTDKRRDFSKTDRSESAAPSRDEREQRRSDFSKSSSERPEQPKNAYPERASRVEVSDKSDYSRAERTDRSEENRSRSDRFEDRRPRYSDYAKSSDRDSERSEAGYSHERESWTPEMTQTAQEWIKETLVLMGKPTISVSTQISHNYLKVNLSDAVTEDARQEETQLKSWGMLAMEAVREKAGKPLRSLRIILESPKK